MNKKIKGLTDAEVERSRAEYGKNTLNQLKSKGFFGKFIENLCDPIIKILLIALAVEVIFTLGHCDLFEIGGILMAILISTTVSTASECTSENAFKKLEADAGSDLVRTLRADGMKELPRAELVVGDIVYLNAGERICADGVIIEGRITTDQSALNGESAEAEKYPSADDRDWELTSHAKLFSGSTVTAGSAVMRVERVGDSTYFGMIASDVQAETRKSPLKLRLGELAKEISRLGYIMAALVAIAYLFNTIVADNAFSLPHIMADIKNSRLMLDTLLHALTLMITVIVVSTPEGLPMMITVVLSANMRRMLRDNILVKKPVGIETAGSLNILFTDKTGTVTSGKLTVDAVITESETYRTERALKKNVPLAHLLSKSAEYNTDISRIGGELTGGNATDRAIAEFFCTPAPQDTVIEKLPFKSENKYSAVTLSSGITLYKGAPDVLLGKCAYTLGKDGEYTATDLSAVKKEFAARTEKGERLIAVACTGKERGSLVFIAMIALKDKIRKGAVAAIKEIKAAGISVVMITGDGKETAAAIAEDAGILGRRTENSVITSARLAELSDEQLAAILPELRVVARALPRDKTRLVKIAQSQNLVVGMTGDGINDAPSLKLADVGFSMGSGTDIARSASDIVILDDSLAAISKTTLYGRTIFKSIRKFITFQLVMNLAACGVSLVGQLVGIDSPITIIQMLWVNIIMDTLGGLAIAGEAPHSYYMKEKPKSREEKILSRNVISHIALTGTYTLALSVAFLCLPYFRSRFCFDIAPEIFYTAFYALFIFSGIFNLVAARCERINILSGISKNKAFIYIMLLISTIQIMMIYFGGSMFRSTPLSARDLLLVIAIAATVLPFDLVRRVLGKLNK